MLLPALGKAREKARAISCTSNLKQCVLAGTMYADDNKASLYMRHGDKAYNQILWCMVNGKTIIGTTWGNSTKYLSSSRSISCPSTNAPKCDIATPSSEALTFTLTYATPASAYVRGTTLATDGHQGLVYDKPNWNAITNPTGLDSNTAVSIDIELAQQPSSAIMFTEACKATDASVCVNGYTFNANVDGNLALRHNAYVNVGFLDGHVSALGKNYFEGQVKNGDIWKTSRIIVDGTAVTLTK